MKIHCDVTAAPETFVHVFFFEVPDSDASPKFLVNSSIRAGRTDEHKQVIRSNAIQSLQDWKGDEKVNEGAQTF